jgi:hypothetical protein
VDLKRSNSVSRSDHDSSKDKSSGSRSSSTSRQPTKSRDDNAKNQMGGSVASRSNIDLPSDPHSAVSTAGASRLNKISAPAAASPLSNMKFQPNVKNAMKMRGRRTAHQQEGIALSEAQDKKEAKDLAKRIADATRAEAKRVARATKNAMTAQAVEDSWELPPTAFGGDRRILASNKAPPLTEPKISQYKKLFEAPAFTKYRAAQSNSDYEHTQGDIIIAYQAYYCFNKSLGLDPVTPRDPSNEDSAWTSAVSASVPAAAVKAPVPTAAPKASVPTTAVTAPVPAAAATATAQEEKPMSATAKRKAAAAAAARKLSRKLPRKLL